MTDGLDQKVEGILRKVPLGMSKFQVQRLIVPKGTPARSYRQAALDLRTQHEALKKAEFRRKRLEIHERQLRKRIELEKDPDERRLLEIDLEEKLFDSSIEDVLIGDCKEHIAALLEAIECLPKVTRESFEQAEEKHWTERLLFQARNDFLASGRVSQGVLEELEKLGMMPEQVCVQVGLQVTANVQQVEEKLRLTAAESSDTSPQS